MGKKNSPTVAAKYHFSHKWWHEGAKPNIMDQCHYIASKFVKALIFGPTYLLLGPHPIAPHLYSEAGCYILSRHGRQEGALDCPLRLDHELDC
ncbi:hypothetical protein VNO77_21925 [Canavalia gladiata]|uniref:Uncharacterized protein n=1 Tax=Canavalia gladiata TaxID=3824 RepID=A0AAN9L484_CANGL